MKKRCVGIIALCLCALTLIACNTIAGAGRDLERGGEAIQGAASRT